MASKSISDLHPDLRPLCGEFLKRCWQAGLTVKLIFTYRSPEEQNKIYAQGRTSPGDIVTNLDGSKSKHCFTMDHKPAAKAFDFGVFSGPAYIADGTDSRYTKAGEIGEDLGLIWGGRWKHPFDPGHLEIA